MNGGSEASGFISGHISIGHSAIIFVATTSCPKAVKGLGMAQVAISDDLLDKSCRGDKRAVNELLRRCRPYVLARARLLLRRNRKMDRSVEADDICQAVLLQIFQAIKETRFPAITGRELLPLVSTMIRNNVANQRKKQQAACRDQGRMEEVPIDKMRITCPRPDPSEQASRKELLEDVQQKLGEEDFSLVEQRAADYSWAHLAEQAKTSEDAIRKRMGRALSRFRR